MGILRPTYGHETMWLYGYSHFSRLRDWRSRRVPMGYIDDLPSEATSEFVESILMGSEERKDYDRVSERYQTSSSREYPSSPDSLDKRVS